MEDNKKTVEETPSPDISNRVVFILGIMGIMLTSALCYGFINGISEIDPMAALVSSITTGLFGVVVGRYSAK